ncbi:MAG: TrmH family RNA methyltransferase, partial [Bacillota bacterium]
MNDRPRGDRARRGRDHVVTVRSPANDRVKLLRGLSAAPVRRRTGLTLVEGIALVREALDSGASLVTAAYDEDAAGSAMVAELAALLRKHGVDVWPADHRVFRQMAQTETPQGILAAVRIPDTPAEMAMSDVIARARATGDALVVLMDGVQDPGNAGSIVRSGDAFGA